MRKSLFQQVDPHELDRYTKRSVLRRRKLSHETVRWLSLLRRALQALPPRELQILYLVKVQGLVQEEARKMYSVHQSNISYRLMRAVDRIGLHRQIFGTISETQLRRKLFSLGFSADTVRSITGVLRTSSPATTARVLNLSPGSIQYAFEQAIIRLENNDPESAELKLMRIIERNLNRLRCIKAQERWSWKKNRAGCGDVPLQGGGE